MLSAQLLATTSPLSDSAEKFFEQAIIAAALLSVATIFALVCWLALIER